MGYDYFISKTVYILYQGKNKDEEFQLVLDITSRGQYLSYPHDYDSDDDFDTMSQKMQKYTDQVLEEINITPNKLIYCGAASGADIIAEGWVMESYKKKYERAFLQKLHECDIPLSRIIYIYKKTEAIKR
jgi:hypothetical protein